MTPGEAGTAASPVAEASRAGVAVSAAGAVPLKARPSPALPELDVLRGLAVVLMVLNHAGYRLAPEVSAGEGWLASLVFIGSFAPVLFFFTTGVGVALSRRGGQRWDELRGALGKAALLVIADQFFYWTTGRSVGLDFLGFIALSTVVMTVVAGLRRPVAWSLALVAGLVVLRYGVGPGWHPGLHSPWPITWLVGVTALPNVSYGGAPWLVYPLVGYVLTGLYLHRRAAGAGLLDTVLRLGAVAAGCLLVSWFMLRCGLVFYRWGVMSLGYFVLSFAALALASALAMGLQARSRRVQRVLALRGVSSFAAVPIHYGLIELLHGAGVASLGAWPMAAVAIGLLAATLSLSFVFAARTERHLASSASPMPRVVLVLLVAACAGAAWATPSWAGWGLALCVVGQLGVAGLLSMRSRRRHLTVRGTEAALS